MLCGKWNVEWSGIRSYYFFLFFFLLFANTQSKWSHSFVIQCNVEYVVLAKLLNFPPAAMKKVRNKKKNVKRIDTHCKVYQAAAWKHYSQRETQKPSRKSFLLLFLFFRQKLFLSSFIWRTHVCVFVKCAFVCLAGESFVCNLLILLCLCDFGTFTFPFNARFWYNLQFVIATEWSLIYSIYRYLYTINIEKNTTSAAYQSSCVHGDNTDDGNRIKSR